MLSSNVEDIEMKDAEDESDEEDAVESELGTCVHALPHPVLMGSP